MHAIPSSLGMLVYREITSMLPIIVSGTMLSMSFILLRKSVASLTYDLVLDISGCRKVSTNADIFSVRQPLAETMSLPGGGVVILCILGKK